MGVHDHRKDAHGHFKVGILTMSTSRSIADDQSGTWMKSQAVKEGHQVVCHTVIPDDEELIRKTLRDLIRIHEPHVMILTGGTGLARSDVTIEAVTPMFRKVLTAFAVIFAQLSFEEIDSAAIMSRSVAGIIGNTVVFCLPGSLKACKLACNGIIFPEMGHVVKHVIE